MSDAQGRTSLSDILSDQPNPEPAAQAPGAEAPAAEAQPAPEAAPEPKPETTEQPRGKNGKFASKETGGDAAAAADPAAAAPTPEADPGAPPAPAESSTVPKSALIGERQRRQAAEARAAELERQQQQSQRPQPGPQPQPTAEERPDFWTDPDSYLEDRFNRFGSSLLDQFERRQVERNIDRSEASARAKYDDYDDVAAGFMEAAARDPDLVRQMMSSDDPGEFAYRRGKTIVEVSQIGDLDEFLAQKRAEWEAEVRSRAPNPAPTLPPSTATDRSAAVPRSGPSWAGPKPLSAILPT